MNKKYNIIAFAGRARSGKSELAKLLKETYDAKIITIANYLKNLCCDILQIDYNKLNELKNNKTVLDLTPDEGWVKAIHKATNIEEDCLYADLANIVIKDIRHMLQFVGTDVIRKYIPSWHIDSMKKEIMSYNNTEQLFVVDDVRFPDEKNAVEELGGKCFFIVRPSTIKEATNHLSEISLSWQDFNYENIIINDEGVNYLKKHFLNAYEDNFQSTNCLFLSNNSSYMDMNMKYGLEHKNEKLFQIIKEQIINNPKKNYFEFKDKELMLSYENEILGNIRYFNKQFDNKLKYAFYNPIIIENFKLLI